MSAPTVKTPIGSGAAGRDVAGEVAYLRERLAELTAERDRLSAELVAAEEYGASLVKLHVANRRLNQAADRGDALDAIQEIIISVVGCEEFAILEHDPRTSRLSVAATFGLDGDALGAASMSSAVVRSAIDSGASFFAPRSDAGSPGAPRNDLTACVPLVGGSSDRVVGAIVLYGLLPHRGELDENDRTLLELIGLESARALGGRRAAATAA